jgi:hypothetical protein
MKTIIDCHICQNTTNVEQIEFMSDGTIYVTCKECGKPTIYGDATSGDGE